MKPLFSQTDLKDFFADKLHQAHQYDVRRLLLTTKMPHAPTITYRIDESVHCFLLQGWHEDRLCVLQGIERDELPPSIHKRFPNVIWQADAKQHPLLMKSFNALEPILLPLTFMSKSALHLEVWEALLRIPSGQVCNYSGFAAMIGKPTATRAIASAIAANPIHWLTPCHRVVKKDGQLGEFSSALSKADLLEAELPQAASHTNATPK